MSGTVLDRTMTTDTEKPDGGSSELTAWNPLEALILPAVRSWGLIAITTVLGAIVGTFLALVKPNEYESHAKIHVRPSLASSANPELAMAEGGDGPTAKPDIANHFHLLTSEEVFLRVAEDLGPMTILQPYHPAEDDNDGTPFLTGKLHEFQSWWFGAYEFEAAKDDQAAYTSNRMTRAAVEVLKGSTS
ncbi:MAG: Wzz/FepE/Etk N-terminal domain-containing protein, partial [Planctomycetota bacterium]